MGSWINLSWGCGAPTRSHSPPTAVSGSISACMRETGASHCGEERNGARITSLRQGNGNTQGNTCPQIHAGGMKPLP